MRGVHLMHPRWATGRNCPCQFGWNFVLSLQRWSGQPVALSASLAHCLLVTWLPCHVVGLGVFCRGAALRLERHHRWWARHLVLLLQVVVDGLQVEVWVVVSVGVGSQDPQGEH